MIPEKIQDYVQQHYPYLKCHFVQQNDRFIAQLFKKHLENIENRVTNYY